MLKLICNYCGITFESGDSCICKDIGDRKWAVYTELLESKFKEKISNTKTKRGNKDGSNRK